MGLSEQTAETLATLRAEITDRYLARTTAVDRQEIDGDGEAAIAVETGYVHGEVTTKIWTQSRGRNQLHIQTLRGAGAAYIDDVHEAIDRALTEVENYRSSGLLP